MKNVLYHNVKEGVEKLKRMLLSILPHATYDPSLNIVVNKALDVRAFLVF